MFCLGGVGLPWLEKGAEDIVEARVGRHGGGWV